MGVKQAAHLSEGTTNTAGSSPLKPSHLVHDEAFYTNSILKQITLQPGAPAALAASSTAVTGSL